MVVQHLGEGRVAPVEMPEVRPTQSRSDAVQAAGKPGVIAEEHLALAVDLPTDRREPGYRVLRALPLLLSVDLFAQESRRPGHRDKALPGDLLFRPVAPKALAV